MVRATRRDRQELVPIRGGITRDREFIERARDKEQDPNTIWTDGSKLESGGAGAGVAWYEEVAVSEQEGSVVFSSRGFGMAGQRREGTETTCRGRFRSMARARSGWRSRGFGMGRRHEA